MVADGCAVAVGSGDGVALLMKRQVYKTRPTKRAAAEHEREGFSSSGRFSGPVKLKERKILNSLGPVSLIGLASHRRAPPVSSTSCAK